MRPTITEIAEDVVATWESIEGETMRDGHRSTLIACIATVLRDERDGLFLKEVHSTLHQPVKS